MNSVIDYMTRNKNKILLNVHPQIYKGVLVPEGTTPGCVLTVKNNKSNWEPYTILNYVDVGNTWMNRQEYRTPPIVTYPYINYSTDSKEVATAEVVNSLINNIYKMPGVDDILNNPIGSTGQFIQLTSSDKTATFSTNIVMNSTTFSRTGLTTTERYTLSATGINLISQVSFDTPPRGIDPVLGTDVATKTYADTLIKDYSGNGVNLYLNYPNSLSKTLGEGASVVTRVTANSYSLIAELITDPDYNAIPSGVWNMTLYGSINDTNYIVKYYFEIYIVSETTNLLETSHLSNDIDSTTPNAYHINATILNHVSLQPSDRIEIKIYAICETFTDEIEVTTYFGSPYYSFISTSLVNPPSTNVSILSMDNTFTKTNEFLLPVVADGITTTRVYSTNAGVTIVEAQGMYSHQFNVPNLISDGISATTLTANSISMTSLQGSNLIYAEELNTNGVTATGISTSTLRASVGYVGGLTLTGLIYANNVNTTGLTATGITVTNLTTTTIHSTNSYINTVESNLTTNNINYSGLTANLYSTHDEQIKLGSFTTNVNISNLTVTSTTIENGKTGNITIGASQTLGILNIGTNTIRSGEINIGGNGCTININGTPTVNYLLTASNGITSTSIYGDTITSNNAFFNFLTVDNTITCDTLIRPIDYAVSNVNNSGYNIVQPLLNFFFTNTTINTIMSNLLIPSGSNGGKKGVWLYEFTINIPKTVKYASFTINTKYNIKYSFSESSTEMGKNVFYMSSADSIIKSNKFTMSLSTDKNIYLVYLMSDYLTPSTGLNSVYTRLTLTRIA